MARLDRAAAGREPGQLHLRLGLLALLSLPERVFNLLAAASVLAWGVLGLVQDGPTVVRVALLALDGVVAWLFARRAGLQADSSPRELMLALPSLVLGGWAFVGAGPSGDWPLGAQILFGVGALWTALSLASLGRSFAVLPALRGLVRRGPYAWLRHPAYLGEALLVGACVWAGGPWEAAAALLPALVLRIRAEERVLSADPGWQAYTEAVRYRLLPGLW